MKKKTWGFALLISLCVLLIFTSPAAADDTVPVNDDDVNEIAGQLYCPVCENVPLDVCPTKACSDWRSVIRQMLEEGKSKDEIIAFFSSQYGWNVLPMPPRVGLNWLIYILPPLIIVGVIILLISLLHKGKREKSTEPVLQDSSNLEDYLAIIDHDLEDSEKK